MLVEFDGWFFQNNHIVGFTVIPRKETDLFRYKPVGFWSKTPKIIEICISHTIEEWRKLYSSKYEFDEINKKFYLKMAVCLLTVDGKKFYKYFDNQKQVDAYIAYLEEALK